MYRQIAKSLREAGRLPTEVHLFEYHPLQLAVALELTWARKFSHPSKAPPQLPTPLPKPILDKAASLTESLFIAPERRISGRQSVPQFVVWDHLIYAYMIENTRIYEIFRKVLHEYLHGERLDIPSAEGQRWLRTTEELFYKDPSPFTIFSSLVSHVRPDVRSSRRNAYYRMFGLDLNHGTDDGLPYSYEKPAAANRDFVPTFEKLLSEVWRGIININNTSGPNTTDVAAILDHVGHLFDTLTNRRRNGSLSREELFFVSTMSWFHLTVEFDSPIVVDLKAEASNPAERLKKIGERVGLPPHGKAEDLFALAEPMSRVLLAIESGDFNTMEAVNLFYDDKHFTGTTDKNILPDDIRGIITNWSSAIGRNIKGEPVTVSSGAVSPATVPSGAISPNGSSRVLAPRT